MLWAQYTVLAVLLVRFVSLCFMAGTEYRKKIDGWDILGCAGMAFLLTGAGAFNKIFGG